MQETSLIIFIVTANPNTDYKMIENILDVEIEKIRVELVSDLELTRVRNQIEARKVRELQSINTKADNLNLFATYFDDTKLINNEIDRYDKITQVQIKVTAEKFLSKNNRVLVQFMPADH